MDPRQLSQINEYTVVRFVAEGGMAWVFEVSDPRAAGVHRALKLLKPEITGALRERFLEEARKLVHVQHPNLVTVHHVEQDQQSGCHFYTMQYVRGGTLSDRLAAQGRLPLSAVTRIFDGTLAALCKLHEAGIAHLDVKPANVLLDENDWPLLGDLGISRSEGLARTTTGHVIGTVRYMSPEQSLGEGCDLRSDVFSAGLTLYRTLVGHSVYDLEVPKAEAPRPGAPTPPNALADSLGDTLIGHAAYDLEVAKAEAPRPGAPNPLNALNAPNAPNALADSLGDTLIGGRRTQPSSSISEMSVLGFLTSQRYAQREFALAFPPELAIPSSVQDVIRKACRMHPDERYPTACELRRAWHAALQAPEPEVTPPLAWDDAEAPRAPRARAATPAEAGPQPGRWERHLQQKARARTRRRIAGALLVVAVGLAGAWYYEPQLRGALAALSGEEADWALARSAADALRDRAAGVLDATRALEDPPARDRLDDWQSAFAAAQAVHAEAARAAQGGSTAALQRVGREYEGVCREVDLGYLERQIVRAEEVLRPAIEASGDATLAARFDTHRQLPSGPACEAAATNLKRLAGLGELRATLAARAPGAALPALTARAASQTEGVVGSSPEAAGEFRSGEPALAAAVAPERARQPEPIAAGAPAPETPSIAEAQVSAAAQAVAANEAKAEAERKRSRAADAQRRSATLARKGAQSATADRNAPELWREAERLLGEGEYVRAEKVFDAASRVASEMLASADDRALSTRKLRDAIAPRGGCAGEKPPAAAVACREAEQSRTLAADALERSDAILALAALGDEERALRAYQSLRYVAPSLLSQTPDEAQIRVVRGAEARAGVIVRDSDPLTFRWTYDGNEVGGNGSQLYFKPQEPGLLAVEVDDGFGGIVRVRWQVELAEPGGENSPPAVGAR